MKQNKKISLWSYGYDLPSFRHRIRSLIPCFEKENWEVKIVILPPKRYYIRIIERLRIIQSSDIIILSKLKLNPFEMRLIKKNGGKIVYDFDDAIYLKRPRKTGLEPGKSWWRFKKFSTMCKNADIVFAGNQTIAEKAKRYNNNVVIIPTPINADDYNFDSTKKKDGLTIVWIGLPGNLKYLELVRPAIEKLVGEFPGLKLKIVSSKFPDWPKIPIEKVNWSSEKEAEALQTSDIGIMPLTDDSWSRGKCAFKLLQYMAAELPCVASPVGANNKVVLNGITGYHAGSIKEWEETLRRLLISEEKRQKFGTNGKEYILKKFNRPVISEKIMLILKNNFIISIDKN